MTQKINFALATLYNALAIYLKLNEAFWDKIAQTNQITSNAMAVASPPPKQIAATPFLSPRALRA